jgi:LPXTG-motif cell wall-anchored protein
VKPTPTKTAVVVPPTHKPKPPTMKPNGGQPKTVKPPVTSPPSELPYTGANHTVEILALGMMLVGMGVLCYTVPEALTGKR